MRIATWNVNSLKARMEKVEWWLDRAAPDIALLQETKLADADAPVMAFAMAGYDLIHHGEGRWNGVAVAVRQGLVTSDVVTNFGDGPVRDSGPGATTAAEEDFDPFHEARVLAVTIADPTASTGGTAADVGAGRGAPLRVLSIYAPNGRVVDSPFYLGKLDWYRRLRRWLDESCAADSAVIIGGDFNVAPSDADVWDPLAVHGGTHVSGRERAAFEDLLAWGLVDVYRERRPERGRFTWWDYRAGNFHKNFGMRIDHLLATRSVADRVVWAEIDREARKGKPIPSDHAPLIIDLDAPGREIDAGWESAGERIAARSGLRPD